MTSLTLVLLAGALTGAGVLLLINNLVGENVSGPAALAQMDAKRAKGKRHLSLTVDRRHSKESVRMRTFGSEVAELMEARGLKLPARLSADLGIVGESREVFLAQTVLYALLGLILPPLVFAPAASVGLASFSTPVWLSLFGVLLGALVPFLRIRRTADDRRRDFRHVVSSFLDLVAMNLAGGRGVPEALSSATSISDGWAMVRIRDTLEAARLQGVTPWTALGQLGHEVEVDELRDMSAALALVAEDGAKVRDSLSARASSMRKRELADAEGRAATRSQSMLVAQLLLCVGFLAFLTYPAVARVLGS